jgi:hypothetical protein
MTASLVQVCLVVVLAGSLGCTGNRVSDRQGVDFEAHYDFDKAELTKFFDDHQNARLDTFSACWPDGTKTAADLEKNLGACANQEVAGTILGTRTLGHPQIPEIVTWYVSGNDGSVYACTRECNRLADPSPRSAGEDLVNELAGNKTPRKHPLDKYSGVRLSSRKDEESRLTDSSSGVSVSVMVAQLLPHDFPGR